MLSLESLTLVLLGSFGCFALQAAFEAHMRESQDLLTQMPAVLVLTVAQRRSQPKHLLLSVLLPGM